MTRFARIYLAVLAALLFTTTAPLSTNAQTGEWRVAFGAHGGLVKYWGTFTDNQVWFGGDAFMRVNIIPWISFHAQFGTGQVRYKIDNEALTTYPAYFGAPSDQNYPSTIVPAIHRDEKAFVNYRTFSGLLSWNITPKQNLIPYVFVGLGLVNFEPRNPQDQALPNNAMKLYGTDPAKSDDEKTRLMIPLGAGLEGYVTDDLVLNFKAQLNMTGTDYFDDLADGGANDVFATFGIGVSYYIFGSLDCDNDGLTDAQEEKLGTDACNADTDSDQLTDFEEVRTYGTDPLKADTDADGLGDFPELRTHTTDPKNADTDADGLNDGQEVNARKTNPKNADTDGDKLTDGDEVNKYNTDPLKVDSDGDALGDGDEIRVHSTNPLSADTDGDGLNDGAEVNTHKTNPKVADSDNDQLKDGDEVNTYKTNPNNPDTDNDKLTDGEEVIRVKTDPLNPDTDGDTVIDGDDRCPLIKGVVERNGCPAPPKIGTKVDFPAIYFIVNTDEFDFSRPETDESLAKMLAYVKQCPGLGVIIEGHASREGNDKRNQELSDLRAKRVKEWLIERGVEASKIEATIGYGSRQNAVQEPDPKSKEAKKMDPAQLEEIRKQNRRIAVRVVRTCD